MARIELSTDADADLEDILRYSIQTFGRQTAEDYLESFENAFILLGEHPHAGMLHADIDPPVHSLPNGSHRIYYDVEGDRVIIQRVLHKAMDIQRWVR